jgi:hypothetical protein
MLREKERTMFDAQETIGLVGRHAMEQCQC